MNWRLIHVNGPVICGIEDEAGAGVADVARELAERYESPLLYVHVLAEDGEMEQAVRMLRNAVPGSGELAIERSRHPADHLVELAEQRGASFLVVGNHGPRSSLLGSISACAMPRDRRLPGGGGRSSRLRGAQRRIRGGGRNRAVQRPVRRAKGRVRHLHRDREMRHEP
jgi:nucleotide-binding universal stress UspA family protein